MTSIGKLLVFLNLFAAMGLLAWSVSANTNRPDYLDAKTAEGQTVEGQISKMKKEITDLTQAVATANGRYGSTAEGLERAEAFRDRRSYVLAQRLEAARSGKFHVQLEDPANSILTDTTRLGPVVKFQGEDLEGVAAIQVKIDASVRAIDAAAIGTKELTPADEIRLSGLAGKPELEQELAPLGTTDLRKVLGLLSTQVEYVEDATRRQKDIYANLREEADFIKDSRLNWVVQLQTLERRGGQLDSRLKLYMAAPGEK